MSARERVLAAVRAALERHDPVEHPGDFAGARPKGATADVPAQRFAEHFLSTGGEVVRLGGETEAEAWMRDFASTFASACCGQSVPDRLRPPLDPVPPARAELGVTMARCAVAETGSLVLGAEDGRRTQLLAPVHVVFVREADVFTTLRDALLAMRGDLSAALGLHSGPSKSADLGQVMVKGVHGPGRVIAAVVGETPAGR